MTLDYKTSKKLCELATDSNVNLMVGHLLLFHPAFQKMKEIVKNGDIGDIQYIYSNRLNLGTIRDNENAFWSLAPHDISLFNFFLKRALFQFCPMGWMFLVIKSMILQLLHLNIKIIKWVIFS